MKPDRDSWEYWLPKYIAYYRERGFPLTDETIADLKHHHFEMLKRRGEK